MPSSQEIEIGGTPSSSISSNPIVEKVQKRLDDDQSRLEYEGPFSIFRVPENIRDVNKSLFEPRVVSIGPYYYHLRNDRLKEMESQKWRLLRRLVDRRTTATLATYVTVVESLEKDARMSYADPITLERGDFIQMLLLDGCFILELFIDWRNDGGNLRAFLDGGWSLNTIFSDLLLSENQIPFVIIERLYDSAMPAGIDRNVFLTDFAKFLNHFAKFLMIEKLPESHVAWPEKINHLLDLYHYFLIPGPSQEETNPNESPPDQITYTSQEETNQNESSPHQFTCNPQEKRNQNEWLPHQIPCTTELYEAGVKFKKRRLPITMSGRHNRNDRLNLFDVKFDGGILEIPPLKINSNNKRLLTSLVALEKHKTRDKTVTSYMALMDSLINTKKDVELLQRARVIQNLLSSHDEAAVFFNQLGDAMLLDSHSVNHDFSALLKNVQLYYSSSWNWSFARLVRDYCNSPWTILSVIAGVSLLGLATLQTFYTIYPYYQPRNT